MSQPEQAMTADVESLVLEHLRAMRADMTDVRERLGRVELRLSAIEQTLGSLYALSGSDRETVQALARRVERLERRVDKRDALGRSPRFRLRGSIMP
jgi:hypothetical protein